MAKIQREVYQVTDSEIPEEDIKALAADTQGKSVNLELSGRIVEATVIYARVEGGKLIALIEYDDGKSQ